MKIRMNYKAWICFHMIWMILLSGMCYEYVKADSLLRCLHSKTQQMEEAFLDAAQNELTEEVYSVRNLNVQLNAIRRSGAANRVRGFWFPVLLLLTFLYHIDKNKKIIIFSAMKPSNQQNIIHYIHQKDGAKG